MVTMQLTRTIVGIAPTSSGNGYWLVSRDGGVFPFGDAKWHGSVRGGHLKFPIVALTRTTTGHGYWLIGQHGQISSFGDAQLYTSNQRPKPGQLFATAVASRHS